MAKTDSGILCINKPAGWTSFDVVRFCRKKWGIKRVGHTGTLDPLATGLLILCLGAATKLSGIFLSLHKYYRATIKFGITTDTDDLFGKTISETKISHLNEHVIRNTAREFIGRISQRPPKYSALKVSGKPAYRWARMGKDPHLADREIEIYELLVRNIELPEVRVEISCSSGTYIRSIARDWGAALGVGGTLIELERVAIGHLTTRDCHTIEELRDCSSPPLMDFDYATSFLLKLPVNDQQALRIHDGAALSQSLFESRGILTQTANLMLLVNTDQVPLALIERDDSSRHGFRYLRVIPEWT